MTLAFFCRFPLKRNLNTLYNFRRYFSISKMTSALGDCADISDKSDAKEGDVAGEFRRKKTAVSFCDFHSPGCSLVN